MIAGRRQVFFRGSIYKGVWRAAGSLAGWWQADADHDVFSFSATISEVGQPWATNFKHQNSYGLGPMSSLDTVSEDDKVVQSPIP